jgi:hypothetical protein
MIARTLLDVLICTGILVGIVALCLLGRWAALGKDPLR